MDTSHGLSLSEVDWGDLKKGTPKYGVSLMEGNWGGKIEGNHRSECMLSEFDWGAHEAYMSGCMLSEFDWGANKQKSMQYATMNDWRFLAWPLDAQKLTQQLNLQ